MSIHSAKAGAAAVFGSVVFGSEFPDHSLCYSPSPLMNRHLNIVNNQENNAKNSGLDGKVLSFDKVTTSDKSPKKKKEFKKTPHKNNGNSNNNINNVQVTSPSNSKRDSQQNFNNPKKQMNNSLISRISEESDHLTNTNGNIVSVNPVINNVRRSKEENVKKKNLSVAELREQRRLETAEAAAFNAEAERTRREVIELRKKLSERFRKAKIEREQKLRQEHLEKVESEIKFKSLVHVEHKQTLKQKEDERRRMSIADRARLRKNNLEGKERMRLLSIQEEQAIFEERHESSVAMKTAKSENAEKRRLSFAFRNGDARRIRQLFADRENKRLMQEHESYELKWAGERDAEDYRNALAKEEREDLAVRNAEGKRIRDLETKMKYEGLSNEHESYELKWAGERDAEDYKSQLAEEEREDFACRNAEGRMIRHKEMEMKHKAQCSEHESFELKWAGERDAEDYKRQLAKVEREDLAFRNAEGRRIRDLETKMKYEGLSNEHESYELKWAGERDAEDYKRQLAQEEREDLAFRNAEGKRIRHKEMEMRHEAQCIEHESYELKWAGERDAEDYRRQLAQEEREDFAFRNEEARNHDAVMKELVSLAKEQEHESYMLKWAGENDAKAYLAEEEELRRQSLAFRNAEGRRHRELDEEERAKEIMRVAENEELNAACQRDVQQYRDACAARDRASLILRGKEHFRKRLESENDRQLQSQEDHESHLLDTQAWQDVNDYVKECKRRKRLSLAFRAKEKRRHAEYAKKQHEKKIQKQQMDTFYRAEDARYVEMAQLKEKARIALKALESERPPCSFNGNPFDKLMG
jgi:hypothetical protein